MSTETNDKNAEIRKFIDNMTEEQKELARKCKTPEEFMKLAADNMIKLSDEQLEIIAGGEEWYNQCDARDCTMM